MAMFSEEILLELPSNSLGPSVVRTAPWFLGAPPGATMVFVL